jgi:hypothetical protein
MSIRRFSELPEANPTTLRGKSVSAITARSGKAKGALNPRHERRGPSRYPVDSNIVT